MRTLKQQQAAQERARNRAHDANHANVARAHQQRIARQDARMPEPIRAVLSGDDHYDRLGHHGATPRVREEW